MSINATLIVQILTFALFVWFTMHFIWPHIITALDEREGKIADGLAAAERGHHELKLAQQKALEELRQARDQASGIIDHANRKASDILEQAHSKTLQERQHLLDEAKNEIAREVKQAQLQLRQQVSIIAIAGAEKILAREIDKAANNQFVEQLVDEL